MYVVVVIFQNVNITEKADSYTRSIKIIMIQP